MTLTTSKDKKTKKKEKMEQIQQKLNFFMSAHPEIRTYTISNLLLGEYLDTEVGTLPFFKRLLCENQVFSEVSVLNEHPMKRVFLQYLHYCLVKREKAGLEIAFLTKEALEKLKIKSHVR